MTIAATRGVTNLTFLGMRDPTSMAMQLLSFLVSFRAPGSDEFNVSSAI